ncbi:hypothetical protein BC629DRAFT_656426 [Irpex lacteus]|nr:hypothetical protein BC629DRAFT_656426 [Irpex lacteus]
MEQSPVVSIISHLFSGCGHCESRLGFSSITTKNLPCEKPAQTVITGTPTSKSLRRSILSHFLTSLRNGHPFRATVDTQNDISHQQNANTHAAFNVRDTFHSDQCDRERPVRGNYPVWVDSSAPRPYFLLGTSSLRRSNSSFQAISNSVFVAAAGHCLWPVGLTDSTCTAKIVLPRYGIPDQVTQ